MTLEAGEIVRIDDQAATRGYDTAGPGFELPDERGLQLAKDRFAVFRKYSGDGFARPFLDQLIGIQKGETEFFGHMPSDGGLAGAHETDEGKVADGGRFVHSSGNTRKSPSRHADSVAAEESAGGDPGSPTAGCAQEGPLDVATGKIILANRTF